jgi:hypothetical protein
MFDLNKDFVCGFASAIVLVLVIVLVWWAVTCNQPAEAFEGSASNPGQFYNNIEGENKGVNYSPALMNLGATKTLDLQQITSATQGNNASVAAYTEGMKAKRAAMKAKRAGMKGNRSRFLNSRGSGPSTWISNKILQNYRAGEGVAQQATESMMSDDELVKIAH